MSASSTTGDTAKVLAPERKAFPLNPAVVAAVGVFLLLLRRNSTLFFHPQFWAEDVFVYFVDNRILGLNAILEPYAGYVQICCRIIAFLAGLAPAAFAPRLYDTAFLASIIFTAFLTFTSPAFKGWGKTFATLALIGAPASSEVFFGMCYTQWVMAPAVALALYETPIHRVRGWTLAGCFCVVGFSSPFVLLATPFVAGKAYWERSRFAFALLGITALIAIFHLRGMIERLGAEPQHGTLLSKLTVSTSVLYRWLLGHNSNATISAIVAMFSLAAIVSYLWTNRSVAARPSMYFLGYGLVLLYVGSSILNPAHDPNQWGTGGRYFYIPIVLFIWTFIAIEQSYTRQNWTLPRSAGALALLFAVHVESVDARFVDANWPSTAECLRHSEAACVSQISPPHLKTVAIPSDFQLKTLTPDELRQFRWGFNQISR